MENLRKISLDNFLRSRLFHNRSLLNPEEIEKIINFISISKNENEEINGVKIFKRKKGYAFVEKGENIDALTEIASRALKKEVYYKPSTKTQYKPHENKSISDRLAEKGYRRYLFEAVSWIKKRYIEREGSPDIKNISFGINKGGIRFYTNEKSLKILDSLIDEYGLTNPEQKTKELEEVKIEKSLPNKPRNLFSLDEIIDLSAKEYNLEIDKEVIKELEPMLEDLRNEDGYYPKKATKSIYLISQTAKYKEANKRKAIKELDEDVCKNLVGRTGGRGWQFLI